MQTSSRPAFIFAEVLFKVKASGRHLSFNTFWQTLTWIYNKSKPYNISDC